MIKECGELNSGSADVIAVILCRFILACSVEVILVHYRNTYQTYHVSLTVVTIIVSNV